MDEIMRTLLSNAIVDLCHVVIIMSILCDPEVACRLAPPQSRLNPTKTDLMENVTKKLAKGNLLHC